MDWATMTTAEIQDLVEAGKKELDSRNPEEVRELILYTHGCKRSAHYHLGKYKHWAKVVKQVDMTKANGYAFIGEFLGVGQEHKLPGNSIVIEVCDHKITAYQLMGEDKIIQLTTGDTRSMSAVIDRVNQAIEK